MSHPLKRLQFGANGLLLMVGCLSAQNANAVPAFARQTGMECGGCHVGSFGPQLTDYGRKFKLNGYVWGAEDNPTKGFSAMAYGGVEHTSKDQRRDIELTDDAKRYATNNALTADQLSIFYAGRILPTFGVFSQATYVDAEKNFAWDNVDLRYADNTTIYDKSLVYGVTVNNSPGVQDVWNTTPAWRFPYLSSSLATTPGAAPYMTSLAQTVGGVGVYGLWNDWIYAETAGYATLPHRAQLTLGIKGADQSDHLHNIAPYWRLAAQHTFGNHYAALGTYGMYANVEPGNSAHFGTNKYFDYALDATYQFTSDDSKHIFSLYGSALREKQTLDADFASGASNRVGNRLTELTANASYYYDNTYGITLGRFDITGGSDALKFPDASNHKPDSAGWTVQVDFTPFGSEDSWGFPWFNNRFFVQYTAYDKFNGMRKNYDGTGRNASDNNTVFVGDWIAF